MTYWLRAKVHGKELFIEVTKYQLIEFKNLPELEVYREDKTGKLIKKKCMKVEELRIGNLVTIDNDKYHQKMKEVPLIVYSITPNRAISNNEWSYSIGLISKNKEENIVMPLYAQMIEFVKPIQLTEEFLLKYCDYKFESKSNGILFKLNYYYYNLENNLFFIEADYEYDSIKKIKYIHELQNLFFALTNEELNIQKL